MKNLFVREAPSPKQLNNELTLKIYAGILCAFILAFALGKLAFHLGSEKCSKQTLLLAGKKYSTRGNSWFYSPGNLFLITGFLITNVILCFVFTRPAEINYLASRFGWMAAANTVLLTVLGLKNTPLSLLTFFAPESYDRINFLHRAVGYATVFLVLLHGVFYLAYFAADSRPYETLTAGHFFLIPAGGAMLLLALGGYFRSRVNYELFYASHVLGFVVVVITTGLHRPNWAKRLPIVMIVAGFIWACDRLLRGVRMMMHFANNEVVLEPMANAGLMLTFKKYLPKAKAGQHCFVWIPKVRPTQTHPFTIVHNSPEKGLVVFFKAQDGFTRAARDCAVVGSGYQDADGGNNKKERGSSISLAGAAEGPYGSIPNLRDYDKIILVAGGSGATYTVGLLSSFLQEQSAEDGGWEQATASTAISFLWVVRNQEDLTWFSDELETFHAENNISLVLQVSGQSAVGEEKSDSNEEDDEMEGKTGATVELSAAGASQSLTPSSSSPSSSLKIGNNKEAKTPSIIRAAATTTATSQDPPSCFTEPAPATTTPPPPPAYLAQATTPGKMNIQRQIEKTMSGVRRTHRVLVAVCGPDGLVEGVNKAIGGYMRADGPSIDVHGEKFGW